MPVPRGSLFGVPNENFMKNKDPNKKHIQWDDENLRENERTKSAKDIIDEPDTPWASPPPELFDSDAEEDEILEEDLMNKRKMYAEEEIKERLERLEMTDTRQSTGVEFVLETTTTETSRSNFSSSDDNKEEEKEDDDTILKSRLFEAQRKSLQCTYDRKRGTTFNKTSHPFVAHHNNDEEDKEDEEKDEEEIKRELEALLNMQRKT